MMPLVGRLMHCTPRILGIGATVFVSIYALHAFGEGYSPMEAVLAFLLHLRPALIVALVVAMAWRWQIVGGVLFVLLGVLYPLVFGTRFHWSVYIIMSGGPALIGMLFLADWGYRKRMRIIK